MRTVVALPLVLAACGGGGGYDDGWRSGEQVAVRRFVADDGTRHFESWIDRADGNPCTWVDPGDGALRCLHTPLVMYLDAACAQPAWLEDLGYGWVDESGTFAAYELAAPMTVARGTLHVGGPGACVLAGGTGDVEVFPAGAPLPASRFATAVLEIAGDTGVQDIRQVGSDGSQMRLPNPAIDGVECTIVDDATGVACTTDGEDRHTLVEVVVGSGRLHWIVHEDPASGWLSPPRAILDTQLELECGFVDVGGTWMCQPEAIGQRMDVHAEAGCADAPTLAILLPMGTTPPAIATSCEPEGCDDVQIHELGAALTTLYGAHPLAGCIELAQLEVDPYALGARVTDALVAADLVVDP